MRLIPLDQYRIDRLWGIRYSDPLGAHTAEWKIGKVAGNARSLVD